MSLIVNCRLPDPDFGSQSKTKLNNPKPHIEIDKSEVRNVEKWDLIKRLYAALEAKMFRNLERVEGGRGKYITLHAGEDAIHAGTDKANQCVLYLVEGKSASSYPQKRIMYAEKNGQDSGIYGWFPLKGKFMNVRNIDLRDTTSSEKIVAKFNRMVNNKEVKAIKELMGLKQNVDYNLPENLISLRYGKIMITVDADSDGFHIASLLINFIDRFYNGLLQNGCVAILRTPVVRVYNTKNKIEHRFYTNAEFVNWSEKNMVDGKLPKGLKSVKYFKGLGTNTDDEIIDDINTAPVVTVIYDEKAKDSLYLAFDKHESDKRKEWISQWRDATNIEDITFETVEGFTQQKITNFINHELVSYTIDALFRTIPSRDDGLKRSHRQALYAALKRFRYGRDKAEIKVETFAQYASALTHYHHGGASMNGTVIKLAQNYTGSNNLPIFNGIGQFGTSKMLGEDAAAPRYIMLNLPDYISHLYDEEMIEIIPKRMVDGEEAEPIYIPAVIPIHLVNGALGIATGYSSFIPNHNYFEIIDWLRERCNGVTKPNKGKLLRPAYRGFMGDILIPGEEKESVEAMETSDPIDEPESDDDDFDVKEDDGNLRDKDFVKAAMHDKARGGKFFNMRGKILCYPHDEAKKKIDLIIEEIPISKGILAYKDDLLKVANEKEVDKRYINSIEWGNDTEIPYFKIFGFSAPSKNSVTKNALLKKLKLEHSLSLNNLTMINTNGIPEKFKNTNEILECYYGKMIELYEQVKKNRLSNIQHDMNDASYKIHFIRGVISKIIPLLNEKRENVYAAMKAHKPSIPIEYLKKVGSEDYTQERIIELQEEYNRLSELKTKTEKLTPQQMWLEKLDNLEKCLLRDEIYGKGNFDKAKLLEKARKSREKPPKEGEELDTKKKTRKTKA